MASVIHEDIEKTFGQTRSRIARPSRFATTSSLPCSVARVHLHVALNDQLVVIVVESRQAPRVGEEVTVSCASTDIYVFDAANGRLLSRGL